MSELIAKVESVRGGWSRIIMGTRVFAEYVFPSKRVLKYDLTLLPGNIRQYMFYYGFTQKISDALGKKDESEDTKAAKADHIFDFLCRGYWKDPDTEGKGGVKKADFEAEKARANRLAEQVEKARTENAAKDAEIAELKAMLAKKGRK